MLPPFGIYNVVLLRRRCRVLCCETPLTPPRHPLLRQLPLRRLPQTHSSDNRLFRRRRRLRHRRRRRRTCDARRRTTITEFCPARGMLICGEEYSPLCRGHRRRAIPRHRRKKMRVLRRRAAALQSWMTSWSWRTPCLTC